jgi:hypothetical protein
MNTKHYRASDRPLPRVSHKPRRRRPDRPGWAAAVLGIVCVAGVFGVLGLLYSLG